jgi:hypothetical protein
MKKEKKIPDTTSDEDVFWILLDKLLEDGVTKKDLINVLNKEESYNKVFRAISPYALQAGEKEYRVYVDYVMPERNIFEAAFGGGGRDKISKEFVWRIHSSCVGMDQTPGERTMLLKRFNRRTGHNLNIAEMDRLGYRPAIHLELYALIKANPDLQRHFSIAALGSYIVELRSQYIARAWPETEQSKCHIRYHWSGASYDSQCRFLCVRKDA